MKLEISSISSIINLIFIYFVCDVEIDMTAPSIISRLVDDIITKVTVLSATDDFQKIITKQVATELGLTDPPSNGAGNRHKIQCMYDVTNIYGNATISKRYPVDIEPGTEDIAKIDAFKWGLELTKKTPAIVGYMIHGYNLDPASDHPIRPDIKKHFRGQSCVFCGLKGIRVDHKNGLYNDPQVLSNKTQVIAHFQSTCNACNIIKRGIEYKTQQSGRRFAATRIPSMAPFGIDFVAGDESFDPTDPDALVGSYYYDPVAFGEGVILLRERMSRAATLIQRRYRAGRARHKVSWITK